MWNDFVRNPMLVQKHFQLRNSWKTWHSWCQKPLELPSSRSSMGTRSPTCWLTSFISDRKCYSADPIELWRPWYKKPRGLPLCESVGWKKDFSLGDVSFCLAESFPLCNSPTCMVIQKSSITRREKDDERLDWHADMTCELYDRLQETDEEIYEDWLLDRKKPKSALQGWSSVRITIWRMSQTSLSITSIWQCACSSFRVQKDTFYSLQPKPRTGLDSQIKRFLEL